MIDTGILIVKRCYTKKYCRIDADTGSQGPPESMLIRVSHCKLPNRDLFINSQIDVDTG